MGVYEKIANFIIKGRWYFFGFFLALMIASICVISFININYDMTKYLPDGSDTKIALQVMTDEFGSASTANILVKDTTPEEVASLAEQAGKIDGVANAIFNNTSEYFNSATNAGLIQIFFDKGSYDKETEQAIEGLRELCDEAGYSTAFSGESVDAVSSRMAIVNEVWIILVVAVAIMLVILAFTSRSWIEPLVYLIVIGAAIVINMGSNIILGEISFISQAISSIMLIAIVMDYCIVLCSRYREESDLGGTPKEAMARALAGSINTILACSLTVLVGLIALCVMDFKIGLDLGLVLAKGVVICILAVLCLMPSVILMLHKPLAKLQHRNLLPKLDKLGTFASKTKWVMPVIMLALIITSICLQQNVSFSYVNNNAPGSKLAQETELVEQNFGIQNPLIIMLPRGNFEAERGVIEEIASIEIDGEKYINVSSGFASTQLADSVNAQYIATNFMLDMSQTVRLMQYIDENINPLTDSVYLYQVIETIQAHPDLITDTFDAQQLIFDQDYSAIAGIVAAEDVGLYTMLTYDVAQAKFGGDLNTFVAIYMSILGRSPTTDVSDSLPAYAVMQGLALLTASDDSAYTQIKQIVASAPFGTTTKAEVMAQGLPKEVVDEIFATFGATADDDTILKLQLAQALANRDDSNQTILDKLALATLQTVSELYTNEQTAVNMYLSDNYSRLMFNINAKTDDENAVALINKVHELLDANENYETYYIVGATQSLIDTVEVFQSDRMRTDLITILGVFLIVLLLMRSISIPVLLVALIQGAIWISLAVGSFCGESIFFVCYLIAMVIQMGATIDYAIVMTDRYVYFRKTQDKVDAIKSALNSSFPTIITSSSILIVATYSINILSSIPLLQSIGGLIGRGAVISLVCVMFVLPQILLLFDKIIAKTTLKSNFYNGKKQLVAVTVSGQERTNLDAGKDQKEIGNSNTQSGGELQNESDSEQLESNINTKSADTNIESEQKLLNTQPILDNNADNLKKNKDNL